jgi:hypothetical protein
MLMRLRPRRFASYSAASARAYHSALLSPACHPATPIESVIRSLTSERDPLADLGEAAHDERAGRQELAQAGRDPGRIVRAGPWQQEPELVPAQAGDQAVAPDVGEEDFADNAQDLVADIVAMGVVDPLEVIDIGHHELRG